MLLLLLLLDLPLVSIADGFSHSRSNFVNPSFSIYAVRNHNKEYRGLKKPGVFVIKQSRTAMR